MKAYSISSKKTTEFWISAPSAFGVAPTKIKNRVRRSMNKTKRQLSKQECVSFE